MRRVLYVTVVLAMLLGTFSVAFAEEQQGPPPIYGDYDPDLLGQVWTYYYGGYLPGERVDVYMYRPPTAWWDPLAGEWVDIGWPLLEGPYWGWWWWGQDDGIVDNDMYMMPPEDSLLPAWNDSDMRRMNLTNEDEVFLYADQWGWYYAEFMHSRDEVWFPCSFPYKWKCNYEPDPFTLVFHSPYAVAYECIGPFCLEWPWYWWVEVAPGVFENWAEPMDTVSPLQVHTYGEGWIWWGSPYFIEEYEVLGYSWKWSDIN